MQERGGRVPSDEPADDHRSLFLPEDRRKTDLHASKKDVRMKVLLIAPSFDPIGQGHGSKRRKGTRYGFWASYTAALLSGIIKKMGHQFEYLDGPMLMWSNAEIVRRIAEARRDLIGTPSSLDPMGMAAAM